MKKITKEMELSIKALGAAMFMGTVCLHIAIVALFAFISGDNFYYHISFAFLIQGMIASMLASATWALCFGSTKSWRFLAKYLLTTIILVALFAITMLIPAINSTEGHFIWIVSGLISTFAFGTAVAVLSDKHFKKTGSRSVLLWELN